MDVVKVSAKTVEDALTEASIELGTSSDNIEYTVIDEGSKGFFGIGGRKAVIEARRKVTEEDLIKEIFEEKPKKSEKPKKEYKEFKKEPKKEQKLDEKQEKKEAKKEIKKEEGKKEIRKDLKKDMEPSTDAKKESKKDSKTEGRKEMRGSNNKESLLKNTESSRKAESIPEGKPVTVQKTNVTAAVQQDSQQPIIPSVEEKNDPVVADIPATLKTPADPEEAKARAVTFIKDVISAMGMNDEVTASFEEDTLCVNIEGENMGIMIGKRGQTLDSLQYLTSLVVNKGKSSYVRVKVDTEDYRNRRKATLENLAKNIAVKVKKTGKPVFLEPMNPYERRIIHAALQNDPYVTTHSEGEEPYRKVVVTLKKEREKDRERNDRGDRRRNYSRYNNNRRGRGNRQDYEHDGRYRHGSYMQESEDAEGSMNVTAEINAQTDDKNE